MCLVHLQAIKASVINRFVLQGAISRIIELNSIHPPHEQHRALHAWQAAGSHPTKHHSLTNSIPARDAQGCEVSQSTPTLVPTCIEAQTIKRPNQLIRSLFYSIFPFSQLFFFFFFFSSVHHAQQAASLINAQDAPN